MLTFSRKQPLSFSCYPHRLADVDHLIKDVLGAYTKQTVYDNFKPVGEVQIPSYYAHVIEKSARLDNIILLYVCYRFHLVNKIITGYDRQPAFRS